MDDVNGAKAEMMRTAAPLAVLFRSLGVMLVPVGAGGCLALAFRASGYEWFAWVALVPLIVVLRRQPLSAELVLGLFLGGMAHHLIGLDFIRTSGAVELTLGPRSLEWLGLGLLGGTYWLVSLGAAGVLMRRSRLPLAVLFPIVWVGYEFLRKVSYGWLDEVGFPWLLVGTTQADVLWLMQVADVGGVWAVSALVAMVNGAVGDGLLALLGYEPRRRAAVAIVGSIAVLVAALSYGRFRLAEPVAGVGPVVCLVPSGCRPSALEKRVPAEQLREADLFVWSETSFGDLRLAPPNEPVRSAVQTARGWEKALFLVGYRPQEEGFRYRSIVVVDADGVRGVYDKQKLVPWSEFTPWLQIEGVTREGNDFVVGPSHDPLPVTVGNNRWRVGMAICYDVCFSEVFRGCWHAGGSGPDFFVVSADEGSDATMLLQKYIARLARFRAIETRRSIVRNAAYGYSGMIDSCGRLTLAAESPFMHVPASCGPLPIDRRTAPYVFLGDWLPWSAMAFLAVLAYRQRGQQTAAVGLR